MMFARRRLLMVAAAAATTAVTSGTRGASVLAADAPPPDPQPPPQGWKEAYVGHYENRLRTYSHPLKVFNYFASVKKGGESFMHPVDFVVSILRFQPNDTADAGTDSTKALKKQIQKQCASSIEFFRLADTNGDGLISYQEYVFFLTLLSTPERQFRVAFQMFDEDGNGQIDLAEFQKIVQYADTAVKQRIGSREQAQKLSRQGGGLVSLFFGKDGKGSCDYATFSAFLQRLHLEVLRLEFFSNATDAHDTISLKDFARSIISYVDRDDVADLTKRAASLAGDAGRISFDQFSLVNKVVANLPSLQYALHLSSTSALSKPDFRRAVRVAVDVDLPDAVVDVLFRLFDSNNDGTLDVDEFIAALHGRFSRGLDQPRDLGVARFLARLSECRQRLLY